MTQDGVVLDDTMVEPGPSSSNPTRKTPKRRVMKPCASRTNFMFNELEDPGDGTSAGSGLPQKRSHAEESTPSDDDLRDSKQKLIRVRNPERLQQKDNVGNVGKCISVFPLAVLFTADNLPIDIR